MSILILALALFMTYRSGVLPAFSAGQPATQNLTTLSTADISAYRWNAMAKFYAGQASATANLTTLSAADVSAYRWGAMANFYATQQAQIPVTGRDLTTLSAADISVYRWQAIADFYTR
ncbi:MAG TPA: hypothetical protein VLA72_19120 [Anaerolineales bacterium]|nr:hypothetical protein [Anaerolineales bacterium]